MPFRLPCVVVEIAKRRCVEYASGAYEVFGTDVIDDSCTAVDNHIGEAGIYVHNLVTHRDFVIIVNNDRGHCSDVEEPFAVHQVIAIAASDANVSYFDTQVGEFGWCPIGAIDASSHIRKACQPRTRRMLLNKRL